MYKQIKKGDMVVILEKGDWYEAVGVCTHANNEFAFIVTTRYPEYLFKVDITNRSRVRFYKEWISGKHILAKI